ncbi:hypothetical protein BVY03_03735, partial [bacterium K02(2017)]
NPNLEIEFINALVRFRYEVLQAPDHLFEKHILLGEITSSIKAMHRGKRTQLDRNSIQSAQLELKDTREYLNELYEQAQKEIIEVSGEISSLYEDSQQNFIEKFKTRLKEWWSPLYELEEEKIANAKIGRVKRRAVVSKFLVDATKESGKLNHLMVSLKKSPDILADIDLQELIEKDTVENQRLLEDIHNDFLEVQHTQKRMNVANITSANYKLYYGAVKATMYTAGTVMAAHTLGFQNFSDAILSVGGWLYKPELQNALEAYSELRGSMQNFPIWMSMGLLAFAAIGGPGKTLWYKAKEIVSTPKKGLRDYFQKYSSSAGEIMKICGLFIMGIPTAKPISTALQAFGAGGESVDHYYNLKDVRKKRKA